MTSFETKQPRYVPMTLTVRPVRTAVMVEAGPNWRQWARQTLVATSRLWGGWGTLLFPRADGSVPEVFWRLLEAHDPDRLGFYLPTFRAWKEADPEQFMSWLERQALEKAKEGSLRGTPESYIKSILDHQMHYPLQRGHGPSPAIKAEAQRRLGVLGSQDNPFSFALKWDDAPPEHFVDMASVDDLRDRRIEILEPPAELGEDFSLWLAARCGDISPVHQKQLSRQTLVSRVSVSLDFTEELLSFAFSPHRAVQRDLLEWRTILGEADSGHVELPEWTHEDFTASTPLGWTSVGCLWVRRIKTLLDKLPYVIVLGDAAEDFYLALAFERLYHGGMWLPDTLVDSDFFSDLPGVIAAVARLKETSTSSRVVYVTSMSLDFPDIVNRWEKFIEATSLSDKTSSSIVVRPDEIPTAWPYHLVDSENLDIGRVEPFVDRVQVGNVDTPRPSGLTVRSSPSTVFPKPEATWWVDVTVDDLSLPPRSCLSNLVVAGEGFDGRQARASSRGLSFDSRYMGLLTPADPLRDRRVSRPTVRQPSAEELFAALFSSAGLSIEPSQAGTYLGGVIDLWGSFDALTAAWEDAATSKLLGCFVSDPGVASEETGVFLEVPKRWFLTSHQMLNRTGLTSDTLVGLVEHLIHTSILSAGLILKCPRCRLAWWYPLEEISASFKCQRCQVTSLVAPSSWHKPALEPHLFYMLDEVAYQALNHDCHIPVLALRRLKSRSSTGFAFVPSIDVYEEGRRVAEVDICAIADGRIVLGEAKTTPRIQTAQLRKVVDVLDRVTGHELCIASAGSFDPRTIRDAKELAGVRVDVMVLENLIAD